VSPPFSLLCCPAKADTAPQAAVAFGDRYWVYTVPNILRMQRDNALGLMDGLQKNWEKVADPKNRDGGGASGMY